MPPEETLTSVEPDRAISQVEPEPARDRHVARAVFFPGLTRIDTGMEDGEEV